MSLVKKYSQTKIDYDSEEIDRLLAERFTIKYDSFEDFKKDMIEKIEKAVKDIEDGKGITLEEYIKKLEAKNEWL